MVVNILKLAMQLSITELISVYEVLQCCGCIENWYVMFLITEIGHIGKLQTQSVLKRISVFWMCIF